MKILSPNFPFAPARWPFFYGWWIVAVATIGIVMSIPGQTMGVSVFTDHLIEATGLTRLQLSTAYLIGTLTSSAILPRGGTLLDRFGSRATAMVSCIGLALTLGALAQIEKLSSALSSLLRLEGSTWVAAVLLTVGFTAMRFSGQGVLTMSSRTMLTKWFERRRGLASGFAGVFIAFGFASAPRILQFFVDLGGWRAAWLGMAVAVGCGMTLVAWLFYRDNPEECGLRMDGAAAAGPALPGDEATRSLEEPGATRAEALRTPGFWWVTSALSLHAMVYTGITFHIVDLGVETGIGGSAAIELFIPVAVVSTVVGLLSGWAADRVSVRVLVLIFIAGQCIGYVGAGRLGEAEMALLMILGWGVGSGLYGTIMSVAMPNFFGRSHLGAIASVQMSCMVAGSAIGPASLALAQTALGSYRVGLLLCCGLGGAAFLFAALAPIPKTRQGHGPEA